MERSCAAAVMLSMARVFGQGPRPPTDGIPGLPIPQSGWNPPLQNPGPSGLTAMTMSTDETHRYQDFTNDSIKHTFATICGGDLKHQLGLGTYLFSRHRAQERANDADFITLRNINSLNRWLRSVEGRQEFGVKRYADDLLDLWRPAGVQVTNTDAPGVTQQRTEMPLTLVVDKRIVMPNLWLNCGTHMGPGDHLYFVLCLRTYVRRTGFASVADAMAHPKNVEYYWRWEPFVSRSNQPPHISVYSGCLDSAAALPTRKKKANGATAYEKSNRVSWVGAYLYVGIIQAFYGEPDPTRWAGVVDEAMYGEDEDGTYKQILNDLPKVEVMLNAPAHGF